MQNTEKEQKEKSGQVYAEMLCDFMFKRLFGSDANKDVLIGFLNMLLEDVEILEVTFIPTEHLGMTEEDRKAVFDISCSCKDGHSFIIEMQKGYQKHFRKRAVYYTTYPINEQGKQAREAYIREHQEERDTSRFRWDFDIKPVTVVGILNFSFDHNGEWAKDKYRSSYRLREDTNHEEMTDVLRFVFLELGRFKKRIWELETRFDKWMYLLKHMHELTDIPDKFDEPEFRRLFILSKIGNFTPEEFKQYEKSVKDMSDYYNIIDTAAEEAEKRGLARGLAKGREEGIAVGKAEGLAEGKAEGKQEANIEVARRMLQMGMAIDVITQATGLDAATVESLRK